jgi:4-oxalocrotonate tautomerase
VVNQHVILIRPSSSSIDGGLASSYARTRGLRSPKVRSAARGLTPRDERRGGGLADINGSIDGEDGAMPLLNVKVIENVFSDEQKKQMVERLTDAMVSIEGENMRGVTWVIVEEVKSGQWGIGGNALTTEDVRALASGVPVG